MTWSGSFYRELRRTGEWQRACTKTNMPNHSTKRKRIARKRAAKARPKLVQKKALRGSDTSKPAAPKRRGPATEWADVGVTAARIAGGMLALGALPVLAPVAVAYGALGVRDFTESEALDLARRQYRDEAGKLHHHTHTYLRDHPEALIGIAA